MCFVQNGPILTNTYNPLFFPQKSIFSAPKIISKLSTEFVLGEGGRAFKLKGGRVNASP